MSLADRIRAGRAGFLRRDHFAEQVILHTTGGTLPVPDAIWTEHPSKPAAPAVQLMGHDRRDDERFAQVDLREEALAGLFPQDATPLLTGVELASHPGVIWQVVRSEYPAGGLAVLHLRLLTTVDTHARDTYAR